MLKIGWVGGRMKMTGCRNSSSSSSFQSWMVKSKTEKEKTKGMDGRMCLCPLTHENPKSEIHSDFPAGAGQASTTSTLTHLCGRFGFFSFSFLRFSVFFFSFFGWMLWVGRTGKWVLWWFFTEKEWRKEGREEREFTASPPNWKKLLSYFLLHIYPFFSTHNFSERQQKKTKLKEQMNQTRVFRSMDGWMNEWEEEWMKGWMRMK